MPNYLIPVKLEMYGLAMVTADSPSEAKRHEITGRMVIADSSNSGYFESINVMRLRAIEVPEELEEEFSNHDNDGGVGVIIDILEENGIDVDCWEKIR